MSSEVRMSNQCAVCGRFVSFSEIDSEGCGGAFWVFVPEASRHSATPEAGGSREALYWTCHECTAGTGRANLRKMQCEWIGEKVSAWRRYLAEKADAMAEKTRQSNLTAK